jgi:hypothetical protein
MITDRMYCNLILIQKVLNDKEEMFTTPLDPAAGKPRLRMKNGRRTLIRLKGLLKVCLALASVSTLVHQKIVCDDGL